MALDVPRLRDATPGVLDHIHLNNAGAALVPRVVLDTQRAHLELEARIGGYQASQATRGAQAAVRASIAALVGAHADEVALHQSATDAWNTAVLAALSTHPPGARVVVDRAVYGSHALLLLQAARRREVSVELVGDDSRGQLDVDALRRTLAERPTALVCLTHIPTSSGLVNPVEAAGEVCAAAGVPLVVDACQSVGQRLVDMASIRCSALSATGRKFLRGPRGTGFLVLRRDDFERFPPVAPDLRAAVWTAPDAFELQPDARRYESWERNIAADLGLGAAVDLALSLGVPALQHRIVGLAASLRARLADVPGVEVHDRGAELCGICTFTVRGHPPTEVAAALQRRGVTVSVTHATSARHDLGHRGLEAVVRASVHAYNTEAELEQATRCVAALARA